jgi:hypothetical protein
MASKLLYWDEHAVDMVTTGNLDAHLGLSYCPHEGTDFVNDVNQATSGRF